MSHPSRGRRPRRARRPARRWATRWRPYRRSLAALLLVALLVVPTPLPAQGPAPGPDAADPITLNFQDADLEVVLDAAARALGFSYVLAPEVRRKVTVQGRIARRELFDVLLAVLEVHGLTAVRSGEIYKIIRIASAQAQGLPVIVGSELDTSRRPEEIVTHLIQVTYGSAAEIARVLAPLVSREGTVVVHRDTNVLVITDAVDKLRRHLRIIRSLDAPTAQAQFQVFPLRFADAGTLASLLGQLFAGASAPAAPPPPAGPPRPGGEPESGPPLAALSGPREGRADRPVILADLRTNTVLATGPPATLERIQALIVRLDTEMPPTRGVYVYRVEHLRAKELAATLTSLFRRRTGESPEGPAGSRMAVFPPGPPGPGSPPLGLPGSSAAGAGPEGERDELGGADIRVIADEPTNTLLVTATAPMWTALQPVLQRLDRMPRRVLIEVLVAEITLDDSTSLGLEWSFRRGGIQIGGERLTLGGALDTGVPGIVPLPPGFSLLLQSSNLLALLQAFSKVNRVNVLSNPQILTSENKKAQIHVGQSVPILTTQQQPTTGIASQAQPTSVITTTVEYRDTGIILTVTPRVSDSRHVALDVRQEVSDAVPNLVTNTQSPVITKRVAETSVVVGEHESLVLGGLIEERKVRGTEGIPFLSRIPILGYLFGTTSESTRKTELLILVTPRIVLDPGESRSLFEELKRRAPDLKQELERLPPSAPAPSRPAPRSLVPDGLPALSR